MNCNKFVRASAAPIMRPVITLALTFHRYRFGNGIVLGTTLVVVACYEDAARRKGMRPSHGQLSVIAAIAATLTMIVQRALVGLVHC